MIIRVYVLCRGEVFLLKNDSDLVVKDFGTSK